MAQKTIHGQSPKSSRAHSYVNYLPPRLRLGDYPVDSRPAPRYQTSEEDGHPVIDPWERMAQSSPQAGRYMSSDIYGGNLTRVGGNVYNYCNIYNTPAPAFPSERSSRQTEPSRPQDPEIPSPSPIDNPPSASPTAPVARVHWPFILVAVGLVPPIWWLWSKE